LVVMTQAARIGALSLIARNGGWNEEDTRLFVYHGCSPLAVFTNSAQIDAHCTFRNRRLCRPLARRELV